MRIVGIDIQALLKRIQGRALLLCKYPVTQALGRADIFRGHGQVHYKAGCVLRNRVDYPVRDPFGDMCNHALHLIVRVTRMFHLDCFSELSYLLQQGEKCLPVKKPRRVRRGFSIREVE
jgi:hypothetical protein